MLTLFVFLHTTAEEINKIIKDINPKKATGLDKTPPKIIKLSANIVDSHFTSIINKDIDNNSFSENAEIVSVRPIFTKKKKKVENYRPVSTLNCFSKIYGKYVIEKIYILYERFLISVYICIWRKLQLMSCFDKFIENWKEFLDKGFVTSTFINGRI